MDMTSTTPSTHIAFYGASLVASGLLDHVAVTVHALSKPQGEVTVLDAVTSHVVDLDLRGSADDVRERYAPAGDEPERADEREMPPEPKRRGRPKLGVVSREVTLLPRHWEWLSGQRGGASVTLRRLVAARRVKRVPTRTAGG